jgi:hypothetical protein
MTNRVVQGSLAMTGDTFDKSPKESVGEAVREGGEGSEGAYEAATEYAREGGEFATQIITRVAGFVQREPWLAMGCAFALGYVTAQLIKRVK